MERKIEIKDLALKKLLTKKKDLVNQIIEITDVITKEEEARMKLAEKLDKLKERILSSSKVHADKIEKSEFEQVRTVDLNKDDEIEFSVVDAVEEFKERFKKELKKK